MSEANFTKGPWNAELPSKSNGYWYVNDNCSDQGSIATCYADNSKNNAHLIASAPEMYEEIEREVDYLLGVISKLEADVEAYLFYQSKLERKRLILAKARGES